MKRLIFRAEQYLYHSDTSEPVRGQIPPGQPAWSTPRAAFFHVPEIGPAGPWLLKQQRCRHWLRKYFSCGAKREFRAARHFATLGVPTVEVALHGVSLWPWSRHESLLVMRYHPWPNARRYLRETTAPAPRAQLVQEMAADIGKIFNTGLRLKDCHLGNLLVSGADGQRLWVDNEYRRPLTRRGLARGLERSLTSLRRSGEPTWQDGEWQLLLDRLAACLDDPLLRATCAQAGSSS